MFLTRTGNNDCKLIIAGGGISEKKNLYLNELLKLTKKLKLDDSVEFKGYLTQKELSTFITSSDIFIIPYKKTFNYSSSAILLRSLSAGVPLIASNVNTISETIQNGYNGILVEKNNVIKISDHMIYLFENPDVRKKLSKNALEYVISNHRWEIVENKVWCSLNNLINQ